MNLHARLTWLMVLSCGLIGCGGTGKQDSKKDPTQSPTKKITAISRHGQKKSAETAGKSSKRAKKAQRKTKKSATSGAAATGIYKYVYPGIQSMVIVRPQQATNHALFALLPAQALDEMFGLDLKQLKGIKQVTAFMAQLTDVNSLPPVALVFEFVSADAGKDWRKEIISGEKREVAGKTVYGRKGDTESLAHVVSETVLIMGSSQVVEHMLLEKATTSELGKLLKKLDSGGELVAVSNIAAQHKLLKAESDKIKPILVPQIAELLGGLEYLQTIGMTVNLSSNPLLKLSLIAPDENGSKALDTIANQALRLVNDTFKLYEAPLRKALTPKMLPIVDVMAATVKSLKATRQDNQVLVSLPKPDGFDTLPVLLKPAIDEARFAARRANRLRNLKFMAIAIHTYHETHKKLPANFVDQQGKPILSWRVRLLPYLDGDAVAARLNKNEPWDSETNKKALLMMPPFYGENKKGIATVLSFNGKRAEKLSDVSSPRETLFGVLVAEENGVPWTKPSDLDPSPAALLKAVRKTEGDRILAMFYAGNLKLLSKDTPTDSLKAMIDLKAGGTPRKP